MKKYLIPLVLSFVAVPVQAQTVFRYTPQKTTVATPEKAPLLDTHIGLGIGARMVRATYIGGTLAGWADSETRIDGALRQNEYLFNLELSRYKAGVNVGSLAASVNPAYSIESASYYLGMSKLMPVGDNAEWGPSLMAHWATETPSNSNFPFSGTPYDYTQNRAGLGLGVRGAIAPTSKWILDGAFTLYPWMLERLDKAPYQLGWLGAAELGMGASYRFTEAMRANVDYRGQYLGGSNFSDQNHRFMVGLSYDFLGR